MDGSLTPLQIVVLVLAGLAAGFIAFRAFSGRRPMQAGGRPGGSVQATTRERVFVSYKSNDVMVVRRVVDLLIASGVPTWFAEYEILLADRDRFQDAIDGAIAQCTKAVLFTGAAYGQSPYCLHEAVGLTARLEPRDMLRVVLDPTSATGSGMPDLSAVPTIRSTDPVTIAREVCTSLGGPLVSIPRAAPSGLRYTGDAMGRPFVLGVDGWEVTKDPLRNPADRGQLLEFRYRLEQPVLNMNVAWSPDPAPETQRLQATEDDREIYQYLITYAPRHMGHLGTSARGVHLLFSGGHSQMGLTYWNEFYWTRKASVVLRNPATGENGEFVFTFGLVGSWGDYCTLTGVMDDVVASLRWE